MNGALDGIFGTAGAPKRILGSWLAGTERFSALADAASAGIITAVAGDASLGNIAGATGLDRDDTARRCAVLTAQGILQGAGPRRVRLAPDLQALTAPGAVQDLADVLGTQRAKLTALAGCARPAVPYSTLAEGDHLAIARNAGAIVPALLTAVAGVLDGIDPLRAWSRPARHVELGCGAGCQLLSPLLVHPGLTAVGVELSHAVAAEARRRARVLGVADRVEIRVGDAGDLPETAGFDTAYWSQPFFPTPTRAPALDAALRALRPGGALVAPVLVEPPVAPSSAGARAWSIEALVFGAWGIPVPSPPALGEVIRAAGFADATVVDAPVMATRPASVLGVGHYLVARKPPISGPRSGASIKAGLPSALDAYVAARARLTGWIAAAEALALLHTALSNGVLAAVIETGTVASAADRTGIHDATVKRVATALAAHGLLDATTPGYRLTTEFEALASRTVRAALGSLIDRASPGRRW